MVNNEWERDRSHYRRDRDSSSRSAVDRKQQADPTAHEGPACGEGVAPSDDSRQCSTGVLALPSSRLENGCGNDDARKDCKGTDHRTSDGDVLCSPPNVDHRTNHG